MKSARYWIEKLELLPHPEGGYYREVYRSEGGIPAVELGLSTGGMRNYATSIYFLLENGRPSKFHRIAFDELWFFHEGSPISIHTLHPEKGHQSMVLGGDHPYQGWVEAHTIFGSEIEEPGGWALVSCVVAPGFDFNDFELLEQADLLEAFPEHASIIKKINP
jgi:predicted cupin superfamily sugar epimerase